MRQFGKTIGKLRRNFTAEERREVVDHLRAISQIVADIERRVRNA